MEAVESSVMELFNASNKPWKKKDIIKKVKSTFPAAKKKQVKKLLKKLEKASIINKVEGQKNFYRRSPNRAASSEKDESESHSSEKEKLDSPVVPIAELLRRRKEPVKLEPEQNADDDNNSVEDIDEEIRKLEAELEADSDDDDSEENYDDDVSTASEKDDNKTAGGGVISMSALASDRIAALPEISLPFNKRRFMKIDREENMEEPKYKKRKKEKRDKQPLKISEGLQAAVKEVLAGYQPRGNEKLPFYCRQCAKQYANEEEFFDHRKTEFHKAAVAMEKKASYCKLCRKQLTSPVQMKEHLVSKKHKELLQKMKSKQGGQQRRR